MSTNTDKPVKYNARLNSWYIDDDEFGSALYDTEAEAIEDRDRIQREQDAWPQTAPGAVRR